MHGPTLIMLAMLAQAPDLAKDVRYGDQAPQTLDVYSPSGAKGRPVVFWLHGGGWVTGDKSQVEAKPRAFAEKGFVFVSVNYRLLPDVDMGTIVRDVARGLRWVHEHIAEYGGDPDRILVMGHSAGAQLAALICTDQRYLKDEGLSPAILKACVPVDGDTYDVPAIIETAEARCRAHGLPLPANGHRKKFGDDPARFRDLSAVTHATPGKGIPPFLILYVSGNPDTVAQAQRFSRALKEAGVEAVAKGFRETHHVKLSADLGAPGDPATKDLFEFVDRIVKD